VTQIATLLLRGTCPLRHLELTLDSLLGQTDPHFVLYCAREALGAGGTTLLARYNEPRFVVQQDATGRTPAPHGSVAGAVQAGMVLHPTWLARLRAALGADPDSRVAICRSSRFDGTILTAGPELPDDPAALARLIAADPTLMHAALMRTNADFTDPATLPASGRIAIVPDRLTISRAAGTRVAGPPAPPQRRLVTTLFGRDYIPADIEADRPPTLHVVIDTEAEFDWQKPFASDLTAVSALRHVESAQAIFDRYGLRPVYLIDYPVASQPEGAAAIRALVDRGAAAVGAHLHPWTNPPLTTPAGAEIDRRLSFPGNLPARIEAAKLDMLFATIDRNFGAPPLFYKAGRYGIGRNTAALIAARGARIDFSLMPETDLRDAGGPDFRMVNAIPYRVGGLNLISVPMTRADVGPLSRWWQLRGWLDTQTAALLHVRAFLVRAALLERLTLTPEGVDARLQIVLLQTLLRRGHRLFVLHFHSPSLAVGHTPYVRTEADRTALLSRIETVCRWFFEELGGVPGRPWDLLEVEARRGPRA
jgi:hypothetical protein